MNQEEQAIDFLPALEKVPSLNLTTVQLRHNDLKKQFHTKTTRQQQIASQNSYSYLQSNRSLYRKGIYSHRLVEDAEYMQELEFVKKYSQNPFFKVQVNMLLTDYSKKIISEDNYKIVQENMMAENQYGIKTLKKQRDQAIREGYQIQQKWLKWLKNAGIIFKQK